MVLVCVSTKAGFATKQKKRKILREWRGTAK